MSQTMTAALGEALAREAAGLRWYWPHVVAVTLKSKRALQQSDLPRKHELGNGKFRRAVFEPAIVRQWMEEQVVETR